ncbi:MAG: hypothetical protein KDI63_04925 [Gammaproteobacteria bacterium]|nr:hypothetical protein [Gammaproteobacteria bacterium]
MSKNEVWYGYLEAGNKSSPVVRDLSLETKSRKTVYLYNHARGCFLEYALEIVEPKLRELTADDIPLKDLRSAFRAARKTFLGGRVIKKWEKETAVSSPPASSEPEPAEDDYSIDLMEDFEEDELEV